MSGPLPAHLLHLGLLRSPFPSTPDAWHYFDGNGLRERLAEVLHCVIARKGFVLITGEVGLGKSTLLRRLVTRLGEEQCRVALVMNTHLRGNELLRAVLRDLGLTPGNSFDDDLAAFNSYLIERHHAGETVALVIDDAQNLCPESLELIRLLSNLETSQYKLVQIVLCGQPELLDTLGQPRIRQLASRISKHVELLPLSEDEAARYVRFRLDCAGADGIRLSAGALRCLYRDSRGNPRRMHLLLDTCLYGLVAGGGREIGADLVRRASAEAGLLQRGSRGGPTRPTRLAASVFMAACALALLAFSLLRQGPASASVEASVAAPGRLPAPLPEVAGPTSEVDSFALCLQRLTGLDPVDAAASVAEPGVLAGRLYALGSPVELVQLPPDLELRRPAVGCLADPQSGVAGWLAWRPELVAADFALGRQGEPVRALQARLAEAGFYRSALDGEVGPRTVAALASFQRERGLPATGYPDALTRYLLEHDAAPVGAASEDS
ncbi:ExeA family protein [Pseudomarimonas salicorniae]|uniref:AAA family ATPase n=1 Tax=Pseudomarimonas salicorniae TaxID=2933270 RepID=A0ABT0GIH0_9GAMM|nr:ExeA family protein [Lysobacter sp. CAU 1642]MCK7593790.1 AAA family ATPase [Lysobacter sp. CAU 1642]